MANTKVVELTAEISLQSKQFLDSIKKVNSGVKGLEDKFKELGEVARKISPDSFDKLNSQIVKMRTSVAYTQQRLDKFSESVSSVNKEAKTFSATFAKIAQSSKETSTAQTAYARTAKTLNDTVKGLNETIKKLNSAFTSLHGVINSITDASKEENEVVVTKNDVKKALVSVIKQEIDALKKEASEKKKVTQETKNNTKADEKNTKGKKDATRTLNTFHDGFKRLALQLRMVNIVFGTASRVISTVVRTMKYAIDTANETTVAITKLDNVVGNLDLNKGVSDELQNIAHRLSQVTIYSNEDVMAMQQLLLASRALSKDGLERASQAVLDLASATGDDLSSSASKLAKVLEAPEKGLSQLTIAGFRFTSQETQMIKELQQQGKLFEAQDVVLKKIEDRYRGMAKSIAETDYGKLKKIANAFKDIVANEGEHLLNALSPLLDKLDRYLTEWAETSQFSNFGENAVATISTALKQRASGLGIDENYSYWNFMSNNLEKLTNKDIFALLNSQDRISQEYINTTVKRFKDANKELAKTDKESYNQRLKEVEELATRTADAYFAPIRKEGVDRGILGNDYDAKETGATPSEEENPLSKLIEQSKTYKFQQAEIQRIYAEEQITLAKMAGDDKLAKMWTEVRDSIWESQKSLIGIASTSDLVKAHASSTNEYKKQQLQTEIETLNAILKRRDMEEWERIATEESLRNAKKELDELNGIVTYEGLVSQYGSESKTYSQDKLKNEILILETFRAENKLLGQQGRIIDEIILAKKNELNGDTNASKKAEQDPIEKFISDSKSYASYRYTNSRNATMQIVAKNTARRYLEQLEELEKLEEAGAYMSEKQIELYSKLSDNKDLLQDLSKHAGEYITPIHQKIKETSTEIENAGSNMRYLVAQTEYLAYESGIDLLETTFVTMGEALVEGKEAWNDWGDSALNVVANLLKQMGALLTSMALASAWQKDWAMAGKLGAGAAAAYVASGATTAVANQSKSKSTDSSSTGNGVTIIQNISAVKMSATQLEQSAYANFNRAKWGN